jgi:hypothetical protein
LLSSFSQLPEQRKPQGREYSLEEIMLGGLILFLLKAGSRNQMNNYRRSGHFKEQYQRLFSLKLPHQDSVFDVLETLLSEELDKVKMVSMSRLFEQKFLREDRLLNRYYLVAVDATGVVSFDERHCEHCLTKKSKSGKVTYFHYVLEAKLVTPTGLAISLASEWIENPEGEFNKQDCERKAFKRLAEKLKKQYPRLPVCILADGLYPYEDAFQICENNDWKFIFVLQDNSLKTVQEELTLTRRRNPAATHYWVEQGWRITNEYRFQTDIEYHKKYTLNWVQCIENRNKDDKKETSHFEYVTNIKPDRDNVREIADNGRLRWKIENEGFNTQKCGGYELEHKFAEKSYNAMKNYYTLLQIAHAIIQMVEKGKVVTAILKMRPKETLRNLWKNLIGYMIFSLPPPVFDYSSDNEYKIAPAPA